ncbi:hypothetical protein M6D81_04670 [Paenibacillus sp. J5C_2022]|uniref:hypothetical protein n=1 Tax=Paenibacillus sp. J5C2022 TaxID=2977129 RepID=UPI0021CE9FC0|nr:hypothetical protein [Paenibacillus sp. J5C2022]MCU6707999.1 hypothetical protein [Paenibacillus sp. J5C2022]
MNKKNSALSPQRWRQRKLTDDNREIHVVKATFHIEAASVDRLRLFLGNSNGGTLWFLLTAERAGALKAEAYTVDEGNESYAVLPAAESGEGVHRSAALPGEAKAVLSRASLPERLMVETRMVGKTAFIYANGIFLAAYELKAAIDGDVTQAGTVVEDTLASVPQLVHFDVQHKPGKFMHISFDDTYDLMKELTVNETRYNSLFDHEVFAYLRDMHEKYGAVFSFYLFYGRTDDAFTMSDMTTKFKDEFATHADWLKFGYHSLYEDTRSSRLSDEEMIASVGNMHAAITRFAGADSIDKLVRFGYFSVNTSALIALKRQGLIDGALTADDERTDNCGLSGAPLRIVRHYDSYADLEHQLHYFRSERRFDGCDSSERMVSQLNALRDDGNNNECYILFGHSVLEIPITAALQWACEQGDIAFRYPMNIERDLRRQSNRHLTNEA